MSVTEFMSIHNYLPLYVYALIIIVTQCIQIRMPVVIHKLQHIIMCLFSITKFILHVQ